MTYTSQLSSHTTNLTASATGATISNSGSIASGSMTISHTYQTSALTVSFGRANSSYNYFINTGSACSTSSSLNSKTYSDWIPSTNASLDVYIAERYTISYSTTGSNSGSAPATQYKIHGTTLSLATNTGVLAKSGGYTFVGWSASSNQYGDVTPTYDVYAGIDSYRDYTANASTTLYPVFATLYNITTNKNGGSGGNVTVAGNQYYVYGYGGQVSLPTLTKTGYNFNKWTVSGAGYSGDVSSYVGGGGYMTISSDASGSITFTANWTIITYTLTISSSSSVKNSGTFSVAGTTRTIGTSFTITRDYSTSAASIAISYTSGSYTYEIRVGGSRIGDNSATYTGWTPTANSSISISIIQFWTITYNYNGGTGEYNGATSHTQKRYNNVSSVTIQNWSESGGTDFNILKDHYHWARSWNTNQSGTGTTYAGGSTYSTKAALYLYAMWNPVEFEVTAYANSGTFTANGSFSGSNSTYRTKNLGYATAIGTLPTVTRSGYKFLGWYTASSGGTQVTSSTSWASENDRDIYAQWARVYTHTVTHTGSNYYVFTSISSVLYSDAACTTTVSTGQLYNNSNTTFYSLTSCTGSFVYRGLWSYNNAIYASGILDDGIYNYWNVAGYMTRTQLSNNASSLRILYQCGSSASVAFLSSEKYNDSWYYICDSYYDRSNKTIINDITYRTNRCDNAYLPKLGSFT